MLISRPAAEPGTAAVWKYCSELKGKAIPGRNPVQKARTYDALTADDNWLYLTT